MVKRLSDIIISKQIKLHGCEDNNIHGHTVREKRQKFTRKKNDQDCCDTEEDGRKKSQRDSAFRV